MRPLVEEQDAGEMYRMLIEWAGHEVLSAENGAMGLELFKSTHLLKPVDPEKLRSGRMPMITRRDLRARLDASTLLASLLSLSFVALAVAVRWLLDPWLRANLALVTIYGAVAAAVWIGGYTQGVAAAIVGYLACDYLFVAPRGTFGFSDTTSFVGALTYSITCAVIVGLGNATHETRRKAHGHSELLRTTLASIGDAVVTTDLIGRVTLMNRMAESLLGRTEDDSRGELLTDVFRAVNEDSSAIENPATLVLAREKSEAGFDAHLMKPVDYGNLLQLLAALLPLS